jgi:predicted nucleotide-binding protein
METQPPVEAPGWNAKAFLAYASEDEDLARAAQDSMMTYLRNNKGCMIDVTPWPVAAEPSESILKNLQDKLRGHDFGIFIYTPADTTEVRESKQPKARDNVVFETGLFMGMKGPHRTIILLPENHEVAPSDLAGIIGIRYAYDEVKGAMNHAGRTGKLGPASAKIVDKIRDVMDQPSTDQRQTELGPPPSDTSTARPTSPLENLGAGLGSDAARGRLTKLDDKNVWQGRFVVHAVHGVGQIMGYDLPNERPRFITVRFGSDIGVFAMSQLFVAPI